MCSLMKLLHKPDSNVMLRKAELQYFLCIHKQLFHSQVAAPENLLKTCLSLTGDVQTQWSVQISNISALHLDIGLLRGDERYPQYEQHQIAGSR